MAFGHCAPQYFEDGDQAFTAAKFLTALFREHETREHDNRTAAVWPSAVVLTKLKRGGGPIADHVNIP